ncbi:hypothetical protein ACQ4LE_005119 [Meloidogyne hapla]
MNKIIIFALFIFSILPFEVVGPNGCNIFKKIMKNIKILKNNNQEAKYLIKIDDTEKITIKIIDDIKTFLFTNEQISLDNINYFANIFILNQQNYIDQIKEEEINYFNQNERIETIYSLLTNYDTIIKEYCNKILKISNEDKKDIVKDTENLKSFNLCKIGFMFMFAKFLLEKIIKNKTENENSEEINWEEETEEFLNISFKIWEEAKQINLGNTGRHKIKTKKFKNKFNILKLEKFEKEIKNKYGINEFNEFD